MITQEQFDKYDRENPDIYELFKMFTFQMIRAGREHYSARTIIHRRGAPAGIQRAVAAMAHGACLPRSIAILPAQALGRWHTDLHARSGDGFKINNIYSPFYTRKFEREFPQHEGFFAKRRSVADREATHA
jgi:hypothetical protein